MKKKVIIFCYWLLAVVAKTSSEEISLEVFFSPNGGCTAAIVKEINQAKQTIRVQAYGFTSKPIASALIVAKKRGVIVSVILDKSNLSLPTSQLLNFRRQGILVLIDARHSIAHNKIIIIDDCKVITGSFNFTNNAEQNNAENVVIINNKKTSATFSENWSIHAEHSRPAK